VGWEGEIIIFLEGLFLCFRVLLPFALRVDLPDSVKKVKKKPFYGCTNFLK
jgi:hypothetical protein